MFSSDPEIKQSICNCLKSTICFFLSFLRKNNQRFNLTNFKINTDKNVLKTETYAKEFQAL